ncbi:hypothetical protein EI555_001320, partial [Monodon monoceros]
RPDKDALGLAARGLPGDSDGRGALRVFRAAEPVALWTQESVFKQLFAQKLRLLFGRCGARGHLWIASVVRQQIKRAGWKHLGSFHCWRECQGLPPTSHLNGYSHLGKKKRIRSFFWKTIPEEQVRGKTNIWTLAAREQHHYQIDTKSIEELFGQQENTTKSSPSGRGGPLNSSFREGREELSFHKCCEVAFVLRISELSVGHCGTDSREPKRKAIFR